jgi:hypothetical protein
VYVLQSPGATATATKKAAYRSTLVKVERKPEVVTLTEGDLQRMLADAPIMTAEQVSSMRHAAEERKEAERAAAKARKEKMLRLQEEARKQVRSSTSASSTTACRTAITMQQVAAKVSRLLQVTQSAISTRKQHSIILALPHPCCYSCRPHPQSRRWCVLKQTMPR